MRSHKRHKAEAAPEVELPITPMLDMAFQLLTFFIFTYHPSGMEGQMELSLPSKIEKAAHTADQIKPDTAPETEPEIQLDLSVNIEPNPSDPELYGLEFVNGNITKAIHNSRTKGVKPHEDAALKELLELLKVENARRKADFERWQRDELSKIEGSERAKKEDEERRKRFGIKVRGRTKLLWRHVVEVMDICRQAGFPNVSFAPPPDFRQGKGS